MSDDLAPKQARVLLNSLKSRGFRLEGDGDQLYVSPADRLTPTDRTEILEHKCYILDTLPQNANNANNAKTPKSEDDEFNACVCRVIERDLELPPGSLELWDPVRTA